MSIAPQPHTCDGRCTCPHHGTPFIYSPAADDHACQEVSCEFGHGVNGVLLKRNMSRPRLAASAR